MLLIVLARSSRPNLYRGLIQWTERKGKLGKAMRAEHSTFSALVFHRADRIRAGVCACNLHNFRDFVRLHCRVPSCPEDSRRVFRIQLQKLNDETRLPRQRLATRRRPINVSGQSWQFFRCRSRLGGAIKFQY